MKNEKGITLIALVITIIVMLILVGVTVNIAINGGLFETANDATRKMEEQTIYDQIVGLTEFEINGDINVEATYSAIQAKFGAENVSELGQDGTFTVTGKHATYTYTLTRSQIDVYSVNSTDVTLNKYRIGYEIEISGTKLVLYFINDDIAYREMYSNRTIGSRCIY